MIRRQYHRFEPGYFYNFINGQEDKEASIEEGLKPYNAKLAKSKNRNVKLNIKWYDHKLYTLFVMRHSS